MKKWFGPLLLAGAVFILSGFNLDKALVPREEILSGGVPKDGIPALLRPKFIEQSQVRFLEPDEKVIGVQMDGQAKAYPIRILNWHEVVNDTVGNMPVVVTF